VSGDLPLDERGRRALERALELLASERTSVSSVADSLSGLEVPEIRSAGRIADLGAGAGFPGIALAAALPDAHVWLIESVRRKCEFMRAALEAAGLENAVVVCNRSEEWGGGEGREAADVVTARAVGPLPVIAELASPLLRDGGLLVAWKGNRDREGEAALKGGPGALAMRPEGVVEVTPYAGSRSRHLHLVRKTGPTPAGLPRRPGMARKRPLVS
jgi:16S rRNA (guanine527-N7)-methyltransferase